VVAAISVFTRDFSKFLSIVQLLDNFRSCPARMDNLQVATGGQPLLTGRYFGDILIWDEMIIVYKARFFVLEHVIK